MFINDIVSKPFHTDIYLRMCTNDVDSKAFPTDRHLRGGNK